MKLKKQNQWKNEYLRILDSGPSTNADWPLAAELIREEMARGKLIPDGRTRDGIANLRWEGITTKGRVFADELTNKIRRSTWSYRAGLAAWSMLVWLVGYSTQKGLDYWVDKLFDS
ncbi:hypothetical protein NOX82_27515 [Pseudomonas citronellolis]|uniref:hypothetical protein n=1 Tax=Pseudomonas citronellolis TaxID=53408 RepID=UPI002111AA61|nr:hypothetical protein [Pseudomonas citronellolis]UUC49579.1 hypothetical protein NOX82_27515 [Pseudomonas citronellolis]